MGWHRVTDEEREDIIRLYLKNYSIGRIAGLTGRSSNTVKRVTKAAGVYRVK